MGMSHADLDASKASLGPIVVFAQGTVTAGGVPEDHIRPPDCIAGHMKISVLDPRRAQGGQTTTHAAHRVRQGFGM